MDKTLEIGDVDKNGNRHPDEAKYNEEMDRQYENNHAEWLEKKSKEVSSLMQMLGIFSAARIKAHKEYEIALRNEEDTRNKLVEALTWQ